jgi:hypothetical protein
MNWNELFEYCDGELIWKPRLQRNRWGTTSPFAFSGKIAGCLHKANHRRQARYVVSFDGKHHSRSHIVWEMHNGPIPEGMQIDHINRNPCDDRLENLRVVTCRQNQQNRSTFRGGSSCKGEGYEAYANVDGKRTYLGRKGTREEANKLYQDKLIDLGEHHI